MVSPDERGCARGALQRAQPCPSPVDQPDKDAKRTVVSRRSGSPIPNFSSLSFRSKKNAVAMSSDRLEFEGGLTGAAKSDLYK